MTQPDRRTVLVALRNLAAVAAAATTSTGCIWLLPRKPTVVCPNSEQVSFPGGPLTIDAHCHVFNGTDLQVEKFLSMVAVDQGGMLGAGAKFFGSILEGLAWALAPSGRSELIELRRISEALKSCTSSDLQLAVRSRGNRGYENAVGDLKASANKVQATPRSARFYGEGVKRKRMSTAEVEVQDAAIAYVKELPSRRDEFADFKRGPRASILGAGGRSITGMIDFVVQNFQYRYVNVHEYLATYNQERVRVVDLMLPSMVDYDFWLARGEPTRTSLQQQVEVMRNISVMTGGRVHGFAPFDPLRQVSYRMTGGGTNSLELVKTAVIEHGFVGVKLYPPMGFAALGNESVELASPGFWNKDWLPDLARKGGLGRLMDRELRELYAWCESEGVPIMAHTGASNGVSREFEALTAAKYWQKALEEFPGLRVSFGHFGGTAPVQDGTARTKEFLALMQAGNLPGRSAFADAGYFVEVLNREPALLQLLQELYEDTAGHAALSTRFMYGTDWEMTLTEGNVEPYLQDFVALFSQFEQRPKVQAQGVEDLAGRFFGTNAANWIGLREGDQARRRLDAFYGKYSVGKPDWALKLDGRP